MIKVKHGLWNNNHTNKEVTVIKNIVYLEEVNTVGNRAVLFYENDNEFCHIAMDVTKFLKNFTYLGE